MSGRLHHLLHPRFPDDQNCITTCEPPVCYCSADEDCVLSIRECHSCPTFSCVKSSSSQPEGSKGVSGGAVAGAVVGSIILLILVGLLFLWYRRRLRSEPQDHRAAKPKDVPASAADVLNRPDPNEKAQSPNQQSTFRIYDASQTNINLDPEAQGAEREHAMTPLQPPRRISAQSNPFEDAQSIQTTSTGSLSTNVIPIALVPRTGSSPGSESMHSGMSSGPARPVRTPELDLNLEHLNVSKDSMPGTGSARSGASGLARNSFMSTATGATDLLNEAPIIVTSSQGPVRQVLGVHKAEVVQAPGSVPVTPVTGDSLKVMLKSRPSVRSPLAASSFGPSDMVKESHEMISEAIHGDPFDDRHSPIPAPPVPEVPSWAMSSPSDSRPTSMVTNAGSVITADISSAQRVQLGFGGQSNVSTSPAASPPMPPRLLQRMASGRLVAPRSGTQTPSLQEQQERAIAHAHATAADQGLDMHRRISNSSVLSAASTRADSILESFPFVPPSPISSLPMRTPPRSPLAQEVANASAPVSPTNRAPSSPPAHAEAAPLDPPDRRVLGMSNASQLSTASSGLGSFPFQIGHDLPMTPAPPSAFTDPAPPRQRASLDTLALTADLASYPLGYEAAPRR